VIAIRAPAFRPKDIQNLSNNLAFVVARFAAASARSRCRIWSL